MDDFVVEDLDASGESLVEIPEATPKREIERVSRTKLALFQRINKLLERIPLCQ